MDIYSISQIPVAKSYFPIDLDIIAELFDNTGALIPIDTTVEFTGNTTNGSMTIISVPDTSLVLVGQIIEGVGIAAGSKVTAKSSSSVTVDKLATISDTVVSFKGFVPCVPGTDDANIYFWSYSNITEQPTSLLIGYTRMRTSDDSYNDSRSDFQWGGWPDKSGPTILPFATDLTQAIPRVKADNIDFIFDFQEDVTGWEFKFTLVDPNGTFELKKASGNVSGGSSDQITVEASETFSRVIPKVLKEETADFVGTEGNYELQFLTNDDKQGTKPGTIVFKDEIIKQDFAV